MIKRDNESLISFKAITEARKLALRHGVWFRSLNRVERGIIDLTVRYVDSIKSTKLAKVLMAIIEKLQATTETMLDKLVRTIGLPLALKMSNIALSWGNSLATKWAQDRSYAKYLALCLTKT